MEDPQSFVFSYFLGYLLNVAVATAVGSSRGRAGAGFLCGLFLPGIGIIVALFLPPPLDFQRRQIESQDAPVQRKRKMPLKEDPMLAWERQQRANEVLEVPEHLRGRKLDD